MSELTKKEPISEGTKVLVVGFGISGRSAIEFCLQRKALVTLSDSSLKKSDVETITWLDSMGVQYEMGQHSEAFCCASDLILISPGVPLDLPFLESARRLGIPVIGELSLAPYYLKTPVIAITGTNGKTTVTTLIGEIIKASGYKVFVGGNIGTPLTDYLAGTQDADWVVLEVSSFQLDSAGTFRPDIGILLNVTPDHLDRYRSFDDYVKSKMTIFSHQSQSDFAILNSDDRYCREIAEKLKQKTYGKQLGRQYFFGANDLNGAESVFVDGKAIIQKDKTDKPEEYDLRKTSFEFSPNLDNATVAILAASLAGCSIAAIKDGLHKFNPLPHRMSVIGEINGVEYINDSKATNIGAVYSALNGIKKPVVLIAGGRDKGGEYNLLSDIVKKKVKAMLLIGEAREKMAEIFSKCTNIELMNSLDGAVTRASELACPGDIVLLSPACASFDMFSGYTERGNIFTKFVNRLSH